MPASKKKAEGRMEKKGTVLLEVVVGGVVRRAAGREEEERSGISRAVAWAEETKGAKAVASIQPGSSAGWLRESSRSGMRLRVGG